MKIGNVFIQVLATYGIQKDLFSTMNILCSNSLIRDDHDKMVYFMGF